MRRFAVEGKKNKILFRWKYLRVKNLHKDRKLTKEERQLLINKQELYGSKWSKIKQFFPRM